MCFFCREFMHSVQPPLVRAKSSYLAEGRLAIDHGDILALIDERPDLRFIKGQNQRTFDIGTFPRSDCIEFSNNISSIFELNFILKITPCFSLFIQKYSRSAKGEIFGH